MARNLIICCDGTNNEIKADLSNVLKMYRSLEKNDEQIVFYDPGIGTIGDLNPWIRVRQKIKSFFSMGVGYGLDENILTVYNFLIDTYREGDRIFLFGFSRGAYTVRALAGLLCAIGLLQPEQKVLANYALTTYNQVNSTKSFEGVARFQEITGARTVPIHFIGVWDTVCSVFVPRADRFYIPSLQKLPYTRNNPHVAAFRQAMAIDERRSTFRLNRWEEPQNYQLNRFDKTTPVVPQDVKQVWFAGVHSDVGGGYPETESGLAKYPLAWIIAEAQKFGMKTKDAMLRHLIYGEARPGGHKQYTPPNPAGPGHESLTGFWWLLELWPKSTNFAEWPGRKKILGFIGIYIPWGERRYIPPGANIHASVFERQKRVETYKPENIPHSYQVEPLADEMKIERQT